MQLRPPGPGVGLVQVRRLTWFPGAEEWAAVQKLVQLLHSDHWVQPPSEEALSVYTENIEHILLVSGSLYVPYLSEYRVYLNTRRITCFWGMKKKPGVIRLI